MRRDQARTASSSGSAREALRARMTQSQSGSNFFQPRRVGDVAQPRRATSASWTRRGGSSPSGRSRGTPASSRPRAPPPSSRASRRPRGACRRGPSRGGGCALRASIRAKRAVPGYGVRMWKVAVSMPWSIAQSTVRSKTDGVVLVHAEDEAPVHHHAEVVQPAHRRVVVAAEVLDLALRAQAPPGSGSRSRRRGCAGRRPPPSPEAPASGPSSPCPRPARRGRIPRMPSKSASAKRTSPKRWSSRK